MGSHGSKGLTAAGGASALLGTVSAPDAAERCAASGAAPPAPVLGRPRPSQRDCGTLPFLIQRDGTWLYRGTPIRRKPLVCLFSSVLRRDEAGAYRLETPVERGLIEVEDVPFVAVELDWSGDGRDQMLSVRTNVDEIVCIGPEHPLTVNWHCACETEGGGAIPYVTVRPGDGAEPIQARMSRAVYYELVALAVPGKRLGEDCLGVWSRNCFFPIGPLPKDGDAGPDDGDEFNEA
jgi:uncharacterized protein